MFIDAAKKKRFQSFNADISEKDSHEKYLFFEIAVLKDFKEKNLTTGEISGEILDICLFILFKHSALLPILNQRTEHQVMFLNTSQFSLFE